MPKSARACKATGDPGRRNWKTILPPARQPLEDCRQRRWYAALQQPVVLAHHFANVMFNVMRGGIFADQYWIQTADFVEFVSVSQSPVLQQMPISLPPCRPEFFSPISRAALEATRCGRSDPPEPRLSAPDLQPPAWRSQPPLESFYHQPEKTGWLSEAGYEGNWRDIFQNWEALAYSYPEFVESMIEHLPECHHRGWLQPLPNHLSWGRLGSA